MAPADRRLKIDSENALSSSVRNDSVYLSRPAAPLERLGQRKIKRKDCEPRPLYHVRATEVELIFCSGRLAPDALRLNFVFDLLFGEP
jgi:hypothetical protein